VTFYEDGAERLLGVEAGMVFYEVKSETRAVSRADVLRIEKVDVKDPYLTVIEGACREPQIGDPLATTQEFFRRQDQQGATDG
jgi:hypothetical protein